MTIIIRRAGADDLGVIVENRLACLADVRGPGFVMPSELAAQTERFVHDEMSAGRMYTWLAEADGQCVGIASMLIWSRPPRPEDGRTRNANIVNMFVVPAHQGLGIGRRLLGECLAAGDELGISKFLLNTTDQGRALYENAGFRQPGDDWLELLP